MVLTSAAHLWALRRDLPLQDVDESTFVRRAVNIAATRDLNPHWFGHPGSTVIYPLAGVYRAWDTLVHDGPFVGASPKLTSRFQKDPTAFYVVGRLWAIALSVGALPLLFLIGRRVFNTRVALIAITIWVVLPEPVRFGRIVRTDSAALFFGLLALWLILRLLDVHETRRCVLAGLAVGLAIASRYFMVALVPCLLVAAIFPSRHKPGLALRSAGVALVSALVSFAVSTPYFFLDCHRAWASLHAENEPILGHSGLSPLGNLRWYLGTAIPASLSWPLVALSLVGVVLVAWRRRQPELMLLLFAVAFLVGICASTLHWQRWAIQILPVLVLLAAFSIDALVQNVASIAHRIPRKAVLAPAALIAFTAVLAIHPADELVTANRRDTKPSTAKLALDWIVAHVRPGSRMIVDPSTLITRENTRRSVDNRFSPRTDTLARYRQTHFDYVVFDSSTAGRYGTHPARYPRQTAFFESIYCRTRSVAVFRTRATRRGTTINIYRLDASPSPAVSAFCTSVGLAS